MYGYIYITENLINHKLYIGQHRSNILDEKYKGSGVLLQKAFKKYGKDNFKTTILDECDSEESLNEREEYWINYFNAVESDNYYNISRGGKGHKCSPWNKGKHGVQIFTKSQLDSLEKGRRLPASEKLKEKLRNRKDLVEYTDEYREKLSKAQSMNRTVNDGVRNIIVKVYELDEYLSKGYIKGRVKKQKGSTTNP